MSKLKFIYGTMNTAKSALLIMQAYQLESNGKKVLIFKPALDNRDTGVVKSRAVPTTLSATVIAVDEIGTMYRDAMNERPHIILIDEVQFMTVEQVHEICTIVDCLEVPVVCYGLSSDFKSEMFESSKRLFEVADEVERVHGECTQCGNEGIVNARFVNGEVVTVGEQVVTGAEELYKVLCRKCFFEMTGGA